MMTIYKAYDKYIAMNKEDLTYKDTEQLRTYLESVRQSDLTNLDEHKKYLELLGHFRLAVLKYTNLLGDRFYNTLKALLGAGADGVYSEKVRFIYELIQNVDDCEYDNVEDCSLEIHFERKESVGKEKKETKASITLTYNEKGFLPENVFAITGIAENYKNMSDKKMEIGEKGIGFKSVFGIADRVIIQSGLFSFVMDKESFIVPEPYYPEDFKKVNGTKLIIETTSKEAGEIYREFVKTYLREPNAIVTKNPVLFLNKLTHLKMYEDSFRQIEFRINRNKPIDIDGVYFDSDATIAIDFKDSVNGYDNNLKKEIKCVRYTMPIEYSKKECISRYGDDCAFEKKMHNITAVIPVDGNYGMDKGILYSFLPTRVSINAPLVMHVPFKLDSSREYVDPQEENLWFKFTMQQLQVFLKQIYSHFCTIVTDRIYAYLPTQKQDFFVRESGAKIDGLYPEVLKGSNFSKEKIFLTTEGTYESCQDVVSLSVEEDFSNAEKIHKLLDHPKKLFIPHYKDKLNMTHYGVEVITESTKKLFYAGLKDSKKFPEIAEMLATSMVTVFQNELERYNEEFVLDENHLMVISKYQPLYEAFGKYSEKRLRNNKFLCFKVDENLKTISSDIRDDMRDMVFGTSVELTLKKFLEGIGFKIYLIDTDNEDFYFMGRNAIALPRRASLRGFANMVDPFDKRKMISSTLKIKQVSQRLNEPETQELSDVQYLQLLQDVRRSLVDAFGRDVYNRFIKIVNNSSGDKHRFLCELLQNADDCLYDDGIIPSLKMNLSNEILTIEYNEKGFTKDNVRAITAIGESTKKKILNDAVSGEKGVGFKSVFEVAEKVEIHSKEFNFRLNHKTPTIPEIMRDCPMYLGTKMLFSLKDKGFVLPSKEMVLRLCLCLRKLKNIRIGKYNVEIVDSEDSRIISIDNESYTFDKYNRHFEVSDAKALEERSYGNKRISATQSIICYRPHKSMANINYLYSTLPTDVKINIPLIIDAPFELNTSRNNVMQNKWNQIIVKEVYNAILEVMHKRKHQDRLDVLKYTGFTQTNNAYGFKCFSEEWLNISGWKDMLKGQKIMPCLNEDKFVATSLTKCIVVPDVISSLILSGNKNVKSLYPGVIIDTLNKDEDENYNSQLQSLDCTIAKHEDNIKCIDENSSVIVASEKMREKLYQYLSNPRFANIRNATLDAKIVKLKIYPIRVRFGNVIETRFVSRADTDIYTHDSEVSSEDIKILDTNILSINRSDKILSAQYKIPQLTKVVKDSYYRMGIEKLIRSNNDAKYIAETLLREYKFNRESLKGCEYVLKGIPELIPLKTRVGEYRKGNKYTNPEDWQFYGELMDDFIVDDEYLDLATMIGCLPISKLEFSPDIDDLCLSEGDLSDDDIEDILEFPFQRKYDIFCGLINQGVISEEQVAEYNLEIYAGREMNFGGRSGEDFIPEDFPGEAVKNASQIKDDIHNKFRNPNEYVQVQRTIWEPVRKIDPKTFGAMSYNSKIYPSKCFCQMCQDRLESRYFERVEILPEPDYAWTEMFLNLCSHCAKDYKQIRSNKSIRDEFIQNIKDEEFVNRKVVEVDIPSADASITFTAKHIAYVKNILSVEGGSKKISNRKRIKEQEKNSKAENK